MKFLHEYEDCLIGIGVGVLLIGLSGMYFKVPEIGFSWGYVFLISFAFSIFDLRHTFSDLKRRHPFMLLLILLNNAADIIIELGMGAYLLKIDVPVLSSFINPYLAQPMYLFYFGVFFIVSCLFWIFEYHARAKKE
jgi:hypothetical protein